MTAVKLAIVLTMWRAPDRASMYESRIRWWEHHVKHPNALFLLDSYGSLKNSSHVLSFNQTRHFGSVARHSSSTYELFALKSALDQWESVFLQFDYVVKVTCKYAIPDLLPWFHSNNPTTTLVMQAMGDANTEILGIRPEKLRTILKQLTAKNDIRCCIENALLAIKSQYTVWKMPPFPVPVQFRTKRRAGDVLSYLRAR